MPRESGASIEFVAHGALLEVASLQLDADAVTMQRQPAPERARRKTPERVPC